MRTVGCELIRNERSKNRRCALRRRYRVGTLVLCMLAVLTVHAPTQAQQSTNLDENCTVSILNRSARVRPNGSWSIGNVPATGLARVRAVCRYGDDTVGGRSGFIDLQPFQINGFEAEFELNDDEPIADGMRLSAPTTVLGEIGQTAQLQAQADLPTGGTRDVTSAESGTNYSSSSPNVATVSQDGLLTAVMSGTAMISASNEGALAILRMIVSLSGDSDGDGIADDLEVAFGLDPDNPADALEDFDFDGLTNGEEAALGTDLDNPDSDFDGLADGAEIDTGTDPLDADTDDDGLIDGLETNPTDDDDGDGLINALDPDRDDDGLSDGVETAISGNPTNADPDQDNDNDGISNIDEVGAGTNPADRDTDDDNLWDGSEVAGGCNPLVFDAPTIVVGRVVDSGFTPVVGADVNGYALRLSNRATSRSNEDGMFQLPGMTVCGGLQVSARAFDGSADLAGASVPVEASAGSLTDVGDLFVAEPPGDQFDLVRLPTAGDTGTSFFLGHLRKGDFNNNGLDDLVAWTLSDVSFNVPAVDAMSVFAGRPDGGFGPARSTLFSARTKTFGNNRDDVDDVDWESGDFDNDGNLDLVFVWQFENKATILPGRGDGTFFDPISIPGIADAQSVGVGDFNEDGNADLVITDGDDNTAEIYLGTGDANFVFSSSLPAVDDPEDVVVADFNGDLHLDFATANRDSDDVSVFLGAGDGAFSTSPAMAAGSAPHRIAAADVTGDTMIDLIALNRDSEDVSIFAGNGAGGFAAESRTSADSDLERENVPQHLMIAELTGDAIVDILVSGECCAIPSLPNGAVLLRGTGGGNFALELPDMPLTIGLRETLAHDLDGDGLLDLVDIGNGDILTALNSGDGAFLRRPTFGVEDAIVSAFATADFNGDDVSDIAYLNSRSGTEVVIARHNDASPGTFLFEQAIAGPPPVNLLAAADFDGDEVVDLAMAGASGSSVSTFWYAKGLGGGAFAAPAQVGQLSALVAGLIAVDYDDEGTVDLVGRTNGGFFRMENLGGASFAGPVETVPPGLLGQNADWLAIGDLDDDGITDFALGGRSGFNSVPDRVSVWTSAGDVALDETTIDIGRTGSPRNGVIADFNNDGFEDLTISMTDVIEGAAPFDFFVAFAVYPGIGDGTFADVVLSPLVPDGNRFNGETDHLLHADFDGDGNEDLVWTDNGPYIRVMLGQGNGTFGAERRYELGNSQNGDMVIVDIDGDMKPDVAVARNGGGPAMFLNR